MSEVDRRQLGFWKALSSLQIGQLVAAPEFISAAAVGAGGGVALVVYTSVSERTTTAGDYVLILGPLVGVVLAALALVISLMTDRYLLLLQDGGQPSDVLRFLRPFILAIGIQSFTLVLTVGYRAAATTVPHRLEEVWFSILSFFFIWSVGEVVAITRNLFAHAIVRAQQARTEQAEQKVLTLRERRSSDG